MLFEGASVVGEGSSAECWVDDNYAGAKVILWMLGILYLRMSSSLFFFSPHTLLMNYWCGLKMFDQYVKRGSHFVECQLLSVLMFKIIGIFAR